MRTQVGRVIGMNQPVRRAIEITAGRHEVHFIPSLGPWEEWDRQRRRRWRSMISRARAQDVSSEAPPSRAKCMVSQSGSMDPSWIR